MTRCGDTAVGEGMCEALHCEFETFGGEDQVSARVVVELATLIGDEGREILALSQQEGTQDAKCDGITSENAGSSSAREFG